MELLNKKLNSYTNNINLKRSSMNPSSIGFLKVREVKAPRRAHAHDAGIDFFALDVDAFRRAGLQYGSSAAFCSAAFPGKG